MARFKVPVSYYYFMQLDFMFDIMLFIYDFSSKSNKKDNFNGKKKKEKEPKLPKVGPIALVSSVITG